MSYEFSQNLQRGLLFFLKTNTDFLIQCSDLIESDYFEYPSHVKFYEKITEYYQRYKKAPNDEFILEEIRKELRYNDDLADYSEELEEINQITESYLDNPEYYLNLVENFAKSEAMRRAIESSIHLVKENRMDEVISVVQKALLVSRTVDYGEDYFGNYAERIRLDNKDTHVEKFPTVLPAMNFHLEGGNSRKELCMVVAPPGTGKSLYLVNQSVKFLQTGSNVLYISLEMSEEKIAKRFDSVLTLVPVDTLGESGGVLEVNNRLKKFQEKNPDSRLIIKEFPTGQANVNTIRSLLNNLKNREQFEPDVIVVDYLELLRPLRFIDSEYLAQQRIAEELRGVGMEMNMLIWTASQPNRQGRKVDIITDAELGDSYGKIRVADFAISINQTEEEYDNGFSRVFVMKARDSKQRYVVPMNIDYSTLRMYQGVEESPSPEEMSVEDGIKKLQEILEK